MPSTPGLGTVLGVGWVLRYLDALERGLRVSTEMEGKCFWIGIVENTSIRLYLKLTIIGQDE